MYLDDYGGEDVEESIEYIEHETPMSRTVFDIWNIDDDARKDTIDLLDDIIEEISEWLYFPNILLDSIKKILDLCDDDRWNIDVISQFDFGFECVSIIANLCLMRILSLTDILGEETTCVGIVGNYLTYDNLPTYEQPKYNTDNHCKCCAMPQLYEIKFRDWDILDDTQDEFVNKYYVLTGRHFDKDITQIVYTKEFDMCNGLNYNTIVHEYGCPLNT